MRDGVAKLFLCWLVWTLAQHHQCNRDFSMLQSLRDSVGRVAFGILTQTWNGHGVKNGVAKADRGGIRVMISETWIRTELTDATFESLANLTKTCVAKLSARNPSVGNHPPSIAFVDSIVRISWAKVNELGKLGQAAFGNVTSGAALESFQHRAQLGRMFWGSGGSLERTTSSDFALRPALSRYLQQPKHEIAASPISSQLLELWGSVLGFKHSELVVAKTTHAHFVGKNDDANYYGGSLDEFADAMMEWLSKERQLGVPLPEKKPQTRSKTQKDEKSPPKDQAPVLTPTPAEPDQGAPAALRNPVFLSGIQPTTDDDVRMVIDHDTVGRVRLQDIAYVLDNAPGDAEIRVCLTALEIVWNWHQGHLVERRENASTWTGAPSDDVSIIKGGTDTAKLILRVKPKTDGTAFAPKDDTAISCVTFPNALIVAQNAVRHEFRIEARKSYLTVCRRDGSSGQFRPIREGEPDSQNMPEALINLAQAAYVEIKNRFPERDTDTKVIGRREAIAMKKVE